MTTSAWDTFDSWAQKLVSGEVTFHAFAAATRGDFDRMARIAARRRRPPAWMGVDDVANSLILHAW